MDVFLVYYVVGWQSQAIQTLVPLYLSTVLLI